MLVEEVKMKHQCLMLLQLSRYIANYNNSFSLHKRCILLISNHRENSLYLVTYWVTGQCAKDLTLHMDSVLGG